MPDYLGELIYVAAFVLFVIFAILRRIAEARGATRRDQREVSVEELPEETRRMLFGDEPPTARPAKPKRSFDPFEEIREIVQDVQQQMDPRTAKPKPSAPTPQAPPPLRPQPVRAQPVSQHPQTPTRPAPPARAPQAPPVRPQPTPRAPAPPRHAPQPQPPRMIPPQATAPRAAQPTQQRQPGARGQRPATARRPTVEPVEGPQTPFPMPSAKRAAPPPRQKRNRWIGSKDDLRRAVVLMEILGPPKSLQ